MLRMSDNGADSHSRREPMATTSTGVRELELPDQTEAEQAADELPS